MYKVIVFNPSDHNEKVKNAMFKAGGGKQGDYDSCCFELRGIGQYRPLRGSQPFLGEIEQIEKVEEIRLEMLCHPDFIHAVIRAMKETHPYEEVAYDVIKLEQI